MREPRDYLNRPVLSLQTMLRQLSDLDDAILPVIPNGQYGRNTFASVQSFQQAAGLPPTGVADLATWTQLRLAHDAALEQLRAPATEPQWQIGQAVELGEENLHLYLVQAMLTALSRFFPQLTAPAPSSVLKEDTAAGLRFIQEAAGLPQTGALDTLTWHALNDLYRVTVGTGE